MPVVVSHKGEYGVRRRFANPGRSVAPNHSLSSIPGHKNRAQQDHMKGIAGRQVPGSPGYGFPINRGELC